MDRPETRLAHDLVAAARARLPLAGVHVVELLVLARAPEEVDVLLVGERRTAVLHRFLQRLHHRPVEPPHLLRGERVAHAVPSEPRAPEDLVAVDVADAGDELLVHQQRLQLGVALREHRPEVLPRHRGLERVDAEVRELGDLLLDGVGLGHEHLAERARVDEAQLPALGERDHDVGVLRHRLARALGPQQLTRHAEVDHQHVVAVELQQQVLPPPLDHAVILWSTSRLVNCLRLW